MPAVVGGDSDTTHPSRPERVTARVPPRVAAPATRRFGPRPPAVRPERRGPGPLAVAALAALAVAGGVTWARAMAGSPARAAPCSLPDTIPGDRLAGPCAVQRGELLVADVGGRQRTYRIGRPGDVLVVGDWDCDGIGTPGLYRPATGEALEYSSWDPGATGSPPASRADLAPGAAVRVTRLEAGCDAITTG